METRFYYVEKRIYKVRPEYFESCEDAGLTHKFTERKIFDGRNLPRKVQACIGCRLVDGDPELLQKWSK